MDTLEAVPRAHAVGELCGLGQAILDNLVQAVGTCGDEAEVGGLLSGSA